MKNLLEIPLGKNNIEEFSLLLESEGRVHRLYDRRAGLLAFGLLSKR
jgi:hypothetical protein